MKVIVKRIFNTEKKETGSILSAFVGRATRLEEKITIENKLKDYAFNKLYPGEGLNIYRDMYPDNPSIAVIRDINNLAYEEIEIS